MVISLDFSPVARSDVLLQFVLAIDKKYLFETKVPSIYCLVSEALYKLWKLFDGLIIPFVPTPLYLCKKNCSDIIGKASK